MWIESICNDESIIEANIRDTKLFSPDYVGKDPQQAVDGEVQHFRPVLLPWLTGGVASSDFVQRIAQYKKTYQTVSDDEVGAGTRFGSHSHFTQFD